ncbi:LOW QUALITY PROTEIN: transmembrane protein 223-like [Falco cherrug]|uniref:LOW QUALITY PROTEIN: transmembrane protein 223-like n=1 Tax=Falco cherrug TaxID=345164 RepID=UPI0024798713|nr:LOW QUALITY PROTEIN: transmembrane protein 223-like [Falco cherrug]
MAAAERARAALEAAAAVPGDVVLFRHERGRFFRLAGLFCAGQGLFWAYLAHFAFTALRPAPGTDTDDPLRPRDNKWRFGFTASCLTLGSLIVGAGCLFPLRAVRRVTLLRGGPRVTISTHGPLGVGQGPTFTVPLRHVSCRAHRSEVPAAIPLKVKGRPFYFLLDKVGQLCNPRLFDITVGAYRKL